MPDLKLDVDSNPLRTEAEVLFVAKFHSFFEILKEGSYKFYILLGSSDMAMVKIDDIYMAKISCSIDPTPVTFEALIPLGIYLIHFTLSKCTFIAYFRFKPKCA